jgi:hypothetical protein
VRKRSRYILMNKYAWVVSNALWANRKSFNKGGKFFLLKVLKENMHDVQES